MVIVLAVLASTPLLWGTAWAAFSAGTANPGNDWSAGTVTLSDDDSEAALFSASGLVPGASGVKCVEVTYEGSLPAAVKLYAAGYTPSNALGAYLNLTVEEGSGGSFAGSGPGSCPDFTASATLYSGTLDHFAATRTGHASGVGSFAPTGAGQARVFRFSYQLDRAAPESTRSGTAAVAFTWEAVNT